MFDKNNFYAADLYEAINESEDWTKDKDLTDCAYQLIDESRQDEIDKAVSHLTVEYMHLLKYMCQPYKQSKKWISTIREESRQVRQPISKNTNIAKGVNAKSMDAYKEALDDAIVETGLPRSTFPSVRPSNWTPDEVTDPIFIEKFLKAHQETQEAKRTIYNLYDEGRR